MKSELCPRCQCCSQFWNECYECDDNGMVDHDCGEDTCCCLEPEMNVGCDICHGNGGWFSCIGDCNGEGKHASVVQNSEEK